MNNQTKLPNFLMVGVAKCGTTSLYNYISQHPDIYMSKLKGPKFITSNFLKFPFKGNKDSRVEKLVTKDIGKYEDLFRNSEHEKIIGEGSTDNSYYYEKAIPVIKKYLNDPKILFILRSPVDRAFSSYLHMKREERENMTFEEALQNEEKRIKNNWEFIWHYKKVGLYYKQVEAYLNNFSLVKIYFLEDLINNKDHFIKNTFKFLGVDQNFIPKTKVHNISGLPKIKIINKLIENPPRALSLLYKLFPEDLKISLGNAIHKRNLKKPIMKEETRKYLINYYKDDIVKLQKLINRDLSAWLR